MTDTDHLPTSPQVLDVALSEHPDVRPWLVEVQRLFADAEDRFESGRALAALYSLTPVPPLHRMLIERCSSLLVAADEAEPESPGETGARPGLYL